jgi:hypothetical protein
MQQICKLWYREISSTKPSDPIYLLKSKLVAHQNLIDRIEQSTSLQEILRL